MSVTITPLKPEIGVEIAGRQGHAFVDPEVASECLAALDRYGVVVYPDAHVDDDDLAAFSHLLGQPEMRSSHEDSTRPEIFVVSLDPTKSASAAVHRGTFPWHIDGTTSEVPHKATLLTCREIAENGTGDTEFANTYAAYAELSDEDKALIADLRVEYGYANEAHLSIPNLTDRARDIFENTPQKVRRLVWERQSGRKSLLLGSTAGSVVGWPHEEGRALLDRLLAWCTQPRFVVRHHWRVGDLVVWDNTGMLHHARPYELTSPRLMHRTTLIGTESLAS